MARVLLGSPSFIDDFTFLQIEKSKIGYIDGCGMDFTWVHTLQSNAFLCNVWALENYIC